MRISEHSMHVLLHLWKHAVSDGLARGHAMDNVYDMLLYYYVYHAISNFRLPFLQKRMAGF